MHEMTHSEVVTRPPELTPTVERNSEMIESMNWAIEHPRSTGRIFTRVMSELDERPELAEEWIYSIPYNEGSTKETKVEGLNIKAAMAIFSMWPNIVVKSEYKSDFDNHIIVRAQIHDLETNSHLSKEVKVRKMYKPRGSNSERPYSLDMLRNQEQSGQSKAIRNVFLAMLPEWFKDSLFEKIKSIIVNPPAKLTKGAPVEPIVERINKGKAAIMKNFKVTQEEIDTFIMDNWDSVDDATLLVNIKGLYNALAEGSQNPDDLFRGGKKNVAMPQEKQ